MFDVKFWEDIKTNYPEVWDEFKIFISDNQYIDANFYYTFDTFGGLCFNFYKEFQYPDDRGNKISDDEYFDIPSELLFGLFETYFDGLGIIINITYLLEGVFYISIIEECNNSKYNIIGEHNYRPEAKLAAVKKAFEIRENQLKEVK